MDSDEVQLAHEINSKTNLIQVQHVGVTAKLRSPLKRVLPECSSAETDGANDFFINTSTTKYNKLTGTESESTAQITPPLSATSMSDSSKLLYEMHAEQQRTNRNGLSKSRMRKQNTYSRIEFQLYNKSAKRLKYCKCQRARLAKKRTTAARNKHVPIKPSFFKRLRMSLKEMCASKAPIISTNFTESMPQSSVPPQGCGIYTFEHGNADFLHATDCPPQVLSNAFAERATYLATRFWAEFFGGLHIGVSFLVTFLLQTYRFLLYSLINTLLVGVLQMTSDYLVKPLLTIAFNGFLQPPLIFIYNILTSFRDLLEPIADAVNNFMKPIATVGRSIRLVHVTYNKKKFVKHV